MQLVIAKTDLVPLLAAAASAAAPKSPMLGHTMVSLDAADGSLRVRASDSYVGISSSTTCAVKSPGACAVDARRVFDSAKALPAGDVQIKATADHLELRSGKSAKFKIPTFPADDLAPPPALDDAKAVASVPASDLLRALRSGSYARDSDDSRGMSGTLLDARAGELRVVGCCSSRMAVATIVVECAGSQLVLPSRGLGELMKLCEAHSEDPVAISYYGSMAVFTASTTTLWTRLQDDKFVAYQRILESLKAVHTVHVLRDAFLDVVKRVSVACAREKTGSSATLAFADGELRLSAVSVTGEASDALECDADFAGVMDLDPDLLSAAIAAAGEDELTVLFSDDSSPLTIRCAGYLAVVMGRRR